MPKVSSLNESFSKPPATVKINPPIPNIVNKIHKTMSVSICSSYNTLNTLPLLFRVAFIFPDIFIFERFLFFYRHD